MKEEEIKELLEMVNFDNGENLPVAYTLEEFINLGGIDNQ